MKTYQDLQKCSTEMERKQFIESAISEFRGSEKFHIACDAELYARQKNPTINNTVKYIYSLSGNKSEDAFAVNHKCASGFFRRFITQQVQFLLGNGVSFGDEKTKERLGRDFDIKLQQAAKHALIGSCAYGFMNHDHVDVFKYREFVPLLDEETGALRAGIRFAQIDTDKPMRMTLYEEDGYTEYIHRSGHEIEVMKPKRVYRRIVRTSEADGTEIFDGENYPSFPIVPLWANEYHQSEIVGIRAKIDCYDLIMSGLANDIEEASSFYWTLENCGGMDDKELAKFLYRMRTVRAASVDGDVGAKATAHTMDVPVNAREVALSRLKKDLYEDYMALDVSSISAGNVTATQIEAAYEPLNEKADEWEYCIISFVKGILLLLGIEDEPTFTRSQMMNKTEELRNTLDAADQLDEETVVERVLTIFGIPGKKDEVLRRKAAEEASHYESGDDDEDGLEDGDGHAFGFGA